MATRLRTRDDTPRYVPTTWKGGWEQTAGAVTRRMHARNSGVTITTQLSIAETSVSNVFDVAMLRLVSDPINGAQTIAGTFDLCLGLRENNVLADFFPYVHIWVSQGDTDTARGTLLADYIDATEFPSAATTQATSLTTPQTLSSVNASDGDRIIVEIGYRATNTTATSRTGTLDYGAAHEDNYVGVGTSTNFTGWVQFSQDIAFAPTYLFLNDYTAPATPSAFLGAWDDTGGAVTKQIAPDKIDSGQATTVARAETSTNTTWDVLLYCGVSGPLAAQTIAGTIDIAIGLIESSASADFALHMHVWVMKPDGTARGTLLTDYVESAVTDELSASVTTAGHILAAVQTLSSVSASAGDRIVVEIGYRATNSVSTSFTGTLTYGGIHGYVALSSTSHEADPISGSNMGTGRNYASYVVFSQALIWQDVEARFGQVAAEVAVSGFVATSAPNRSFIVA